MQFLTGTPLRKERDEVRHAFVHVQPVRRELRRDSHRPRINHSGRGQAFEGDARRDQIVERRWIRIDMPPIVDVKGRHDLVVTILGGGRRGHADVVCRPREFEALV